MYQYPPRAKSPAGISVPNGQSPRPGLASNNSSASLSSMASHNQYYQSNYYSQHQNFQVPQQYSHYQFQHQNAPRIASRSISNPYIASPSMSRPKSLYNLTLTTPPTTRYATPPADNSFTYSSGNSQPSSPMMLSPAGSYQEITPAAGSHNETRRRSLSASGAVIMGSAPKPDRYHRRRKTGEQVIGVSAAPAAGSVAAVSSSSSVTTGISANSTPSLRSKSSFSSNIGSKNASASSFDTPKQMAPVISSSGPRSDFYKSGGVSLSTPIISNLATSRHPPFDARSNSDEHPYNPSGSRPLSPSLPSRELKSPASLILPSDSRRTANAVIHPNESASSLRSASSSSLHIRGSSVNGTVEAGNMSGSTTKPVLKAALQNKSVDVSGVSASLNGPTQLTNAVLYKISEPRESPSAHSSKLGPPLKSVTKNSPTHIAGRDSYYSSLPVEPTPAHPNGLTKGGEVGKTPGSFSSKLKKAFSFGKKRDTESSSNASGKRLFSEMKSNRTASIRSRWADSSDNKSVFSVKSNASTASFATLRKVGSSIAKGFSRNKSSMNEMSRPPSMAMARNDTAPMVGSVAIPVVTHAVAEAEINRDTATQSFRISPSNVKDNNSLSNVNAPSLHLSGIGTEAVQEHASERRIVENVVQDKLTRADSPDAIPSLTSSSASDSIDVMANDNLAAVVVGSDKQEEGELQEDLAQGDTIFPKSLDLLTVESIRSTIERSKSLERRRSRRSAHREEIFADEHVPNAQTVHVTESAAVEPLVDVPTPKSILKSSTGSIRSNATAKSYEENDEVMDVDESMIESHTSSITAADIDLKNLVTIDSDSLLGLDFDMEQMRLTEKVSVEQADVTTEIMDSATNSEDGTSLATVTPTLSIEPVAEDLDGKASLVDVSGDHLNVDNYGVLPTDGNSINGGTDIEADADGEASDSALEPTPSPERRPFQQTHQTPPLQQIQYFEQPPRREKIRRQKEHSQYHYHPIYHQRMQSRNYGVSHQHSRTPSFASSSSSGGRHSASTPPRSSTDGEEELQTPIGQPKNTVSFSSRIVIYDTYGRGDYDRRPDLATCNRITPHLAQQIKEELNSFKMEMDIHDESRRYTHFF